MHDVVRASALIQAVSAATLVVQNLLAPRLMGAESYGQALALIALPLLLQGLIEPAVNGAAIASRARTDHFLTVRQNWEHLGFLVVPIAVLTLTVANQRGATPWQLLLLASFVALVLANTALRGLAFAGRRDRVLVLHLIGAFFATVAAAPFLVLAKTTGYLAMLCLVQFTVLLILLGDRHLRAEALSVMGDQPRLSSDVALLRTYASNLAWRGGQLAIGPGMLLLASWQLPLVRLAEFRVCQSLVGVVAYAVPAHSTVLQAAAASTGRLPANPGSRESRSIGATIIVAVGCGAVVTFALWLGYPEVVGALLRRSADSHEFRNLLWAAPFFVSAPLLGGVLLGWGYERPVFVANLLVVPASVAIGLWYGAAAGFAIGSVSLSVALGVAAGRRKSWWRGAGG